MTILIVAIPCFIAGAVLGAFAVVWAMTPSLFVPLWERLDTSDNPVFSGLSEPEEHDTEPAPPPSPMTDDEAEEWIAYVLDTWGDSLDEDDQ